MAPDEGEAMLDVAADYPKTLILDALRPASVAASEAEADFIIDPAQYRAAFAADLPEETTRVLAATQRPFVGSALATPSGPAAWKTLPSWYAVATADQAIHPDQERFYANAWGHDDRGRRLAFDHGLAGGDDRGADPLRGGRPGLTPFPIERKGGHTVGESVSPTMSKACSRQVQVTPIPGPNMSATFSSAARSILRSPATRPPLYPAL